MQIKPFTYTTYNYHEIGKLRLLQIIPAPKDLWAVFKTEDDIGVERVVALALAEPIEEDQVTDRIVVGLYAASPIDEGYPSIDVCEKFENFKGYVFAENALEAIGNARLLFEMQKKNASSK